SSTGLTLAGVTNSNPSSFTIESLDITLANPSLAGYDFAGWFLEVAHLTPVTGVAIIEGSTGNITFYARFVPIIYTITYAFNNSTGTTLTGVTNANPSSFTIESLDITLVNPSLAGYDFDGWFLDTTHLLPVTGVAILEGSTGNRIFYARFVPINYTITYVFNSSTGRTLSGVTNTNPETFTIESLDITLANPSLTGYDFAGWFLEVAHLTPVTGVAITEGSIGNRTFYARFTPITYTITYVYNSSTGFTLTGVTNSNLSSFTIESSDITLANPSLASFEFAGWFLEAAHLTPVTGVAILEGSTGNRTFYARFMPIAYTITYVFNSSSGITLTGVTNNNPAGFNAETADITLANPSLAGYDFDGWFLEEAHLTPVTGVAILEGSTGNRTFYGRFMPIAYTITYVFNSSTGRTLTGVTNTNPGTFTIESLDITLVNPSLTGYKFAGWFFNSSERVKGIAIAQGSIGNITFYARFVPIIYTITYVFSSNGTTLTGVTNTNPSTFTIESLDITLVDPARVGFDFVGWFLDSDHLIPVTGIAITEGSIGNITFYAKFVPSTYRITFDVNNGNALVPSSQIVTFDTAYILPTPTKTGHTFAGWYYNTNNIPMTGTWTIANDVTLVASWTANTYTIFYESNRPANATHDIRGTMTNSNHQFGVVSQLSENNFNLVGWTFQGWLTSDNQLITDSSFVAELFDKIDLTYSTIILRASWVINSYQVLFLAEDGITIINTGNTTKEFGSLIESPQAPVIEGKTFVRFEGFIPGQTVSGNHSFRAIYVNDTTNNPAQRFTVIFKNADGTIISQHNNIIEGTTIVSLLPENPTMTGNQFIGWDVFTNVNQTIISNLVLTAVFAEVQMRTIEFVYRDELGNVLIKRVNAPVGTPIATLFPLAPMFAGKSFVGWSGYREGMVVSDDFTLVAEYINSTGQFITINFVCSETNINYTRIVERGTLASLVGWPILQREGFEFLGWYGFTGDELTEDITVTAMWESLGTNNGLNWPVIVSVLSAIWIIAIIILIVIFKRRKRLLTRQAA
ncbi:MAG: InlB B-repeat-containing protein, partial [Erysipelotrichales bacterium]|nr:InlB B-repeat-containing protein [Erysipelotrichales bacterium]